MVVQTFHVSTGKQEQVDLELDHSDARENVTQKFTHLYSDVFKICADKGPESLFTVVVINTLPLLGLLSIESREPRPPASQGTTGGFLAVILPDA